jgi:hypothetical protein
MKTFLLIILGILFTSSLSTELRSKEDIRCQQMQERKVDSIAVEVKRLELKIKN